MFKIQKIQRIQLSTANMARVCLLYFRCYIISAIGPESLSHRHFVFKRTRRGDSCYNFTLSLEVLPFHSTKSRNAEK